MQSRFPWVLISWSRSIGNWLSIDSSSHLCVRGVANSRNARSLLCRAGYPRWVFLLESTPHLGWVLTSTKSAKLRTILPLLVSNATRWGGIGWVLLATSCTRWSRNRDFLEYWYRDRDRDHDRLEIGWVLNPRLISSCMVIDCLSIERAPLWLVDKTCSSISEATRLRPTLAVSLLLIGVVDLQNARSSSFFFS